jgi:hypothetical protein
MKPLRRVSKGVWLALLAIVLHGFAPLLAPVFAPATSAQAAHAHGQAAAPAHHHGSSHAAAEQPPDAPDLVCIGDCPCCTLSDRPLPVLTATPSALLLPDTTVRRERAAPLALHVIFAGTHHLPRAPPACV